MDLTKLKKDQRGLSLLELVIAIALSGIISAAITMTVFQVFNMNTRSSNRMTAVSQVLNAGTVVSQDIMQARTVTPGNSSNPFLTLTWEQWVTNQTQNNITVVYSLTSMGNAAGDLRILWREYYVNAVLNSTTKVAEYIKWPYHTRIEPSQSCTYPNCGAFIFTVTATVGNETEQRPYKAQPRPGS